MSRDTFIPQDDPIHHTFNAGFIILSYIISVAGCATCLELLQRRTARSGLYNWFLLLMAAVAMGGIGIWCMHFIGNRATILHDGTLETQISYDSGFTALSFFLPICVLTIAFYFIGVTENADKWYIIFAGMLTGASVCGMHYVGQLGISNYKCSYEPGHVVGASIIAVVASVTALGVFFRLRASWTNSWWKRGLCAMILAMAVAGMHHTAAAGTFYYSNGNVVDSTGQLTPTETVIVCTVLACAACILLITLAIIGNRHQKRSADRVRQLVLACAYFDSSGRVMVSPDGSLPTQKITDQYVDRAFADDDLHKSHPAFLWAFRATRNWPILSTLIPGMRYHLVTDEAVKKYVENGRQEDPNTENSDVEFGLIFKELFCVAAQELASHLNQPLDELGELYDDIVITGTYKSGSNMVNMVRGMSGRPNDIERGPVAPAVGKGQVLFAVRHLDKQEASFLASSGYRFAPIPQIAPKLAKEMQITHNEMLGTLQSMEDYSLPNKRMEPGVHLVCFSLTPSLPRGFDILVPKNRPNVLPYKSLPIAEIAQWQQDILHRMDGLTLTSCIRWLKANGGYSEPEKIEFCRQMHKTVSRLASYLTDPALGQAKFSSRPVKIPCRNPEGSRGPSKCTAYSFRIINNLQDRAPPPALCLRPLRLFNAQQQVYPQVPDHEHFRSAIIEEFSHCVAANHPETRGTAAASSSSSLADIPRPGAYFKPFHSYPKSELSRISSEGEKPLVQRAKSVFGGIVVSNQVTVDVVERPASTGEAVNLEAFEMNDLNTTMVVGGFNHADRDTFVDELCAMCRDNDEDVRRGSA